MSTDVSQQTEKTSAESVPPKTFDDLSKAFYGVIDKKPAHVGSETVKPVSTEEKRATPSEVSTETVKPASTDVEQSATGSAKGKPEPTELEKELLSQKKANSKLGRENKETREQLDRALEAIKVLEAKFNGTYEEPQKPNEDQVKFQENFRGREVSSRRIAVERYGEEAVNSGVYDSDSEFVKLADAKPWVVNRVAASDLPAMEAMQILAEEKWFSQYGSDPSKWMEKIETSLKQKHFEEFKKQATVTPVGQAGPTVSEARGSGGGRSSAKTVEELFYGAKR